MPDPRRAYPSDLSDAEWALLAPLLPPSAACDCPRKWPERHVADAIFYVLRSGCAWRMLPRESPPWPTVFARFRRWRRDGTLRRAHDTLRTQVRENTGRKRQATAAVIDSQSAKTTGVGGPERGYDGAKRLKSRKRHLLVDTMGLVLLACVHAADVHDRDGARSLIEAARHGEFPRLELAWVDQGYAGALAHWLEARRGWRAQVVRHPERQLRRYGLEGRSGRSTPSACCRGGGRVPPGRVSARSRGSASRGA
jgi:putative transposase